MREKVLKEFGHCCGFLKVDGTKGYCVAYFAVDFEMDNKRLEKISNEYKVTACFCQNIAQEFDSGFCLRVDWYQENSNN